MNQMSPIAIAADKASGYQLIPISEIYADSEFNCRGTFTADKILELAKDVGARGLLQPVTVRELWDNEIETKARGFKYFLISGFRRLAAYKSNEAEVIPCTVRNVQTEFDCRDINAVENLQREQLTFWQEAKSIRHYWIADWTRQAIAERVHKSPGWVQQRIQLLEMEPEIQKFAEQGYIVSTDIRELSKFTGADRLKAANSIRDARKRGDTKNLQVKLRKKNRPGESKSRHRIEIEELMSDLRMYFKQVDRSQMVEAGHILSEQGNCILQLIMAWTVGNATNLDLHMGLRDFFRILSVEYELPDFETTRLENLH